MIGYRIDGRGDDGLFESILLASDGSKHADRAAETAINLVRELEYATITILHVTANSPNKQDLINSKFDVKSILLQEAHAVIQQTKYRLREEGIRYKVEVALGEPAEEIVKFANRGKFGLIIIGSRGLNRIKEVLLGSVSHEVAHHAKCPVMIVK
jgi:nucleotide-binding universal stress UspA family protein